MTRRVLACFVAATIGAATAVSAQDAPESRSLHLEFDGSGRVTLSARNVTTRDILAEWARQCGCFVVNADRLNDAPSAIPLQFTAATQADVLRSLLRQSAGYVLTPKRPGSTSPSDFETIYVVAAAASTAALAPIARPSSPVAAPIVAVGSPDDEIPPVVPIAATPEPGDAPPPPGPEAPAPPPTPGGVGGFVVPPITPSNPTTTAPATRPGGVTPPPGTQP
jgi:hypothetical protein